MTRFRTGERGEGRLSTLVFAGFIVIGVTGAIGSSLQFAVADSAGDVPDQVTQALSVLSSDFFLPFVVGSLLVLFATGVCILRFGGLPRCISEEPFIVRWPNGLTSTRMARSWDCG